MTAGFDITTLRQAASEGRIYWHKHALERILERGITLDEIVAAIMHGDIVKIYLEDRPFPSALVSYIEADPLHVVAAVDSAAEVCHVITAYRPDSEHFETDLKTRRKGS